MTGAFGETTETLTRLIPVGVTAGLASRSFPRKPRQRKIKRITGKTRKRTTVKRKVARKSMKRKTTKRR